MSGVTRKIKKPALLLFVILTIISVMALPASASTPDANSNDVQSRKACRLIDVDCSLFLDCGILWMYPQNIYLYRCDNGDYVTEKPFGECC